MKLGLYVHIPFCLQKCTYCDFATTAWTDNEAARSYMARVKEELRWALPHLEPYELHTVYFGGGTPSLLQSSEIQSFMDDVESLGLSLQLLSEVTLEINPGTLSSDKLDRLLDAGVTRYSVGSQTFQDHLWKPLGREHSPKDSLATLELLASRGVNFTTDLLYGLPYQTLQDLEKDLDVLSGLKPPHVSTYNLTLPPNHILQKGRASDETQAEMYFRVVEKLAAVGLEPYEISNLARDGYSSLHNQIYWQGGAYWGLGMSSHSYLPERGPWGTRFWNASSLASYEKWVGSLKGRTFEEVYGGQQREDLTREQALIDFVHTSLRQVKGFTQKELVDRFGETAHSQLIPLVRDLQTDGLMNLSDQRLHLTPQGRMLLNTVLSRLFV